MNVINAHMELTKKEILYIYENVIKSRYLDVMLQKWYYRSLSNNKFYRSVFSGIGAELGPSAISVQLKPEDILIPRYRGFATFLGRGVALDRIIGEFFGKKGGATKGIGDTASLRDLEKGIPGYSVNLGSMFSIALGIAFAKKIKGNTGIVVQFFGDGEASRSTFGSALNLAVLWKLPILFVCENNGVCIDMDIEHMSATKTIAERAEGYGLTKESVNELKPLYLCERAKSAIAYVRKRRMPMLFEIIQKRFALHSSEFNQKPITTKDIASGQDPLSVFETELIRQQILETALKEIEQSAKMEVEQAFEAVEKEKLLAEQDFFSIYHE